MTLIIGVTARRGVELVTDREVTAGGSRFDAYANKNVVYRAPNGIVALAFTGPAFLGGMPTDRWIVETVTGYSVPQTDPPPMLVGVETLPRWPQVGYAMRLLKKAYEALRPSFSSALRRERFEIVAVGYQWNRRWFRPDGEGREAPSPHPAAAAEEGRLRAAVAGHETRAR